MRSANKILGFLSLTGLLLSNPVHAEIYKYIKDGVVHYSQQKPIDQEEVEELQPAQPPAEAPEQARERLQRTIEGLDERREDRIQTKEEGADAVAQRKALEDYCKQVRSNLKTVTENTRIAEKNDSGELVPMTEEQRQARIQDLQQKLQNKCKDV